MTEYVTIHEAKTHLSRLIRAVAEGREIVIARGKEPVAKLVPIENKRVERKPGALKGMIKVHEGAFDPWTDDELGNWFDKPITPE